MKKLTILLAFLLFTGMQVAFAQRVITGTITSAEDGSTLPGVSVIVKGTSSGAISDMSGKYRIEVPDGEVTLVFSFVGMKTKEVITEKSTEIDVVMEPGDIGLEEVVVTALGISREKKALGYSVQEVSGEDISDVRDNNFINSLSGKVAGVQITSSSGNMGGSSRILLRGANSISGENQPLFVVDGIPIDNSNFSSVNQRRGAGGYDYGNMAQDINPDDIESISILKGANAAALYGSRASNGVILITTKKGKLRKGLGVSVNSSVTWEQVSRLPKFQNQYGGGFIVSDEDGGRNGFSVLELNGSEYLISQYAVDESWGPELDQGYEVVHWDGWYDYEQGLTNTPQTREWASNPDNIRNFYETGVTYTNNVALSGGTEKTAFRVSYTNMDVTGVMPNSEMQKHNVNFSGSAKLGKRLTAFAVGNYTNRNALGRPTTGYDGNNVSQQFYQWGQRQWDMDVMSNYKNPDGSQRTWNRIAWNNPRPKYTDNPYWTRYMNYQNDARNRFFGNIGLTLEITDWMKATAKAMTDYYTDRREERIAIGSQATSQYVEGIREVSETNFEFLLQIDKALSDAISLNANIGLNRRDNWYQRNVTTTGGGLAAPEFYNLAGGIATPTLDDYYEQKRVNSIFGQASLGFMGMFYLDATLRNDWSSTLPEENNSYLYPSVSASVLLSEIGPLKELSWFSFGKLRLGIAQVGNDTNPYQLLTGYNVKEPFGAYPRATVPNSLKNPDLKPETTTSWEIGTDLRFFNDRVGIDFAYYSAKTIDQIISVDLPGPTGYQSQVINAGEMTNKGIELMLYATPIKYQGFRWDISFNWAKNQNEVVELTEGIDKYHLANAPFSVEVAAAVGEPYGAIIGTNYSYTDAGEVILDGGVWLPGKREVLGSVMADWTGGISNTFSYKGLSASVLIDIQQGGQLFSTSYMWGMYSGMLEETAGNNELGNPKRASVDEGGGVLLDGVMEDEAGNYVPNTVRADMNTLGLYHYFVAASDIFDADYVKLRELRVGYTIPNRLLGKVPIRDLRISFIGRNLAIWGTTIDHIDPSHATNSGNIQGIEGAQVPPVRSYGVNLSFNL